MKKISPIEKLTESVVVLNGLLQPFTGLEQSFYTEVLIHINRKGGKSIRYQLKPFFHKLSVSDSGDLSCLSWIDKLTPCTATQLCELVWRSIYTINMINDLIKRGNRGIA